MFFSSFGFLNLTIYRRSFIQWCTTIIMTWKTNNIFTYILQSSIQTQKMLLNKFDKVTIRDHVHELVDKIYDFLFKSDNLLEEVKNFLQTGFTVEGSVCLPWKFADQVLSLVIIYLFYSHYDVIKRSFCDLWDLVKTRWWVLCAVCVLAGTFARSFIERLDVVQTQMNTSVGLLV